MFQRFLLDEAFAKSSKSPNSTHYNRLRGFFSALYPGQCLVIPLLLRKKIVDSTLYFLDFVDLYKSNEMTTNTNFGVFLVTGIHKEQVIQVHPTVDSLWLSIYICDLKFLSPIASVATVIN